MGESAGKGICGGCCLICAIVLAVVLGISFQSLDQLEPGLNYNSITLHIEDTVYTKAGLFFLGPGHWFIKYPSTIQTIEFVAEENDRLQTRTSDGLPVSLSLSFQYRYDESKLRELYLRFKTKELPVYENTAKAVIANVATNFSAYTFFNDKQGIAVEMESHVRETFGRELFARIVAFQITRVELPRQFQDAILQSIEAKQNITSSQRYKENMEVTFNTQILVANQTKLQTIALARGYADRRAQQAEAVATVTEQSVYSEMYAYGNLSQTVSLDVNDTLTYMWWNEQYETQGKEFLVGMNPQSYIRAR